MSHPLPQLDAKRLAVRVLEGVYDMLIRSLLLKHKCGNQLIDCPGRTKLVACLLIQFELRLHELNRTPALVADMPLGIQEKPSTREAERWIEEVDKRKKEAFDGAFEIGEIQADSQ
jgi:hypothetical protein